MFFQSSRRPWLWIPNMTSLGFWTSVADITLDSYVTTIHHFQMSAVELVEA